ncbi:MAG: flagellar basal body-associated FliL family protein [Methylomonas sp.]|jgi:flagellar FliL protein|uniref:flagellar basal body-associated FliL family protein n=1 Tax=Methylomonas sp. TaxID=418 RepID=UPI0025E07FA8|nr:flagellar basal body-associated FliL family protein [Methylomonas sp.]MCK9607131.1 flagellar basal body-associated FliL family protein [Methylomonas sp.]
MAETEPKDAEKKSSKKLIIIIAAVVLLLGGGAGGYFFFISKPADSEQTGKNGENKAAAEEMQDEADPAQEEQYYELSDPLLVNFPAGASAKIIKVSVTVLVKGEANVAVLKKHEPMIRNNLLMAISSIGADKAKTLEGKQELQATMLTEIGKVMELMTKKNPVKAVYFTEFVMQ